VWLFAAVSFLSKHAAEPAHALGEVDQIGGCGEVRVARAKRAENVLVQPLRALSSRMVGR
jgi:hypothetical protein